MRLLLQRASFLHFGRHDIQDDFLKVVSIASAKTCLSAARDAIRLINEQYEHNLLNSLWYNLHCKHRSGLVLLSRTGHHAPPVCHNDSFLDVFTAIGVLLYLQTLEKSKLDMLDQPSDDQSLECGMSFLRMASRSSKLAARYLSMLEHILSTTALRTHGISNQNQFANGSAQGLIAVSTSVGSRNHALEFEDFTSFDNINPQDLLFGTGLPYDVLQTDWPNYSGFT